MVISSKRYIKLVLIIFMSKLMRTRCLLVTGVQTCALPFYVVCDHLYTVHVNRLRPLLSLKYVPVYPKVEPHDMTAIFAIVEKVLALSSAASHAAVAAVATAAAMPAAPAKPLGPNTLTDRKSTRLNSSH